MRITYNGGTYSDFTGAGYGNKKDITKSVAAAIFFSQFATNTDYTWRLVGGGYDFSFPSNSGSNTFVTCNTSGFVFGYNTTNYLPNGTYEVWYENGLVDPETITVTWQDETGSEDLPSEANEGDEVSGTISAAEGRLLTEVLVLGENVAGSPLTDEAVVAFTMPADPVEITVKSIPGCDFPQELMVTRVQLSGEQGVGQTAFKPVAGNVASIALLGTGLSGEVSFGGIIRGVNGPLPYGKYEFFLNRIVQLTWAIPPWTVQPAKQWETTVSANIRGFKIPGLDGEVVVWDTVVFTPAAGVEHPDGCDYTDDGILDSDGTTYIPEAEAYDGLNTVVGGDPDQKVVPPFSGWKSGGDDVDIEAAPTPTSGCADVCQTNLYALLQWGFAEVAKQIQSLSHRVNTVNDNLSSVLVQMEDLVIAGEGIQEALESIDGRLVSSTSKNLADLVEEIEPVWIENEWRVDARDAMYGMIER